MRVRSNESSRNVKMMGGNDLREYQRINWPIDGAPSGVRCRLHHACAGVLVEVLHFVAYLKCNGF